MKYLALLLLVSCATVPQRPLTACEIARRELRVSRHLRRDPPEMQRHYRYAVEALCPDKRPPPARQWASR